MQNTTFYFLTANLYLNKLRWINMFSTKTLFAYPGDTPHSLHKKIMSQSKVLPSIYTEQNNC